MENESLQHESLEKKEFEKENIGDELRQRRMQLGYSIADVEEQIKIRGLYIEAIEEENVKRLPPRVYTVGFVRRYCSFLQIEDTERVAGYYKKLISFNEQEKKSVPAMQGVETKNRGGVQLKERRLFHVRYDRILLAVLLILGAAWAGIFAFSFISEKWDSYQQHQAEKEALRQQQEIPSLPAVPDIPEVQEEVVPQEDTVWDHLEVKLVIKENQECWISATIDGVSTFNGIKKAGETLEFEAENQFSLHLGNAGVVQLFVNGRDVTGDDWKTGQVLETGYSLEQWNQQSMPAEEDTAPYQELEADP